MPRKLQKSSKSRFECSEKDFYFWKIPRRHNKLIWEYKQGKFVTYFLNSAARTCSYGLKILENIEMKCVFQSKAFFQPVILVHKLIQHLQAKPFYFFIFILKFGILVSIMALIRVQLDILSREEWQSTPDPHKLV